MPEYILFKQLPHTWDTPDIILHQQPQRLSISSHYNDNNKRISTLTEDTEERKLLQSHQRLLNRLNLNGYPHTLRASVEAPDGYRAAGLCNLVAVTGTEAAGSQGRAVIALMGLRAGHQVLWHIGSRQGTEAPSELCLYVLRDVKDCGLPS